MEACTVDNGLQNISPEKTTPDKPFEPCASVGTGLADAFGHFAETTTFGGVVHTYISPHFLWRASWVVIVFFLTCLTVWNTTQVVQDYLAYPVVTTVELADQASIPFPSVTLCNRNPIDCTKLAFAYIKNPEKWKELMGYSNCRTTLVTPPLKRRLVST